MPVPAMDVNLIGGEPFDGIVVDVACFVAYKKFFGWNQQTKLLRFAASCDWLESDTGNGVWLLG